MTQFKMWQNSKTQIGTKLKNSKREKTQELKMWKNSKTQHFTKLKTSKYDKNKIKSQDQDQNQTKKNVIQLICLNCERRKNPVTKMVTRLNN